jgi:hypothetical protein
MARLTCGMEVRKRLEELNGWDATLARQKRIQGWRSAALGGLAYPRTPDSRGEGPLKRTGSLR